VKTYVCDTHALFWHLIDSPRLGVAAKRAFEEGDAGQAVIIIPSIVLAELYYVIRKSGAALNFAAEFGRMQSAGQYVFTPFEPEHVVEFDLDHQAGEMHDRIILGVARRMQATLLTKDESLRSLGSVRVAW
jgi:predicted nucleic acid-binding protein